MSRFVHKAANVILQLVIFFIVEHREFRDCCNFLIPIILTDARVRVKLGSFLTRKCVTHHSSLLVEYSSKHVFCHDVCNMFQRIHFVKRDETDFSNS